MLLSLDLESIYELNPRQLVDAPQYLREYVCAELGEPGPFTRALWFHGTRTFAGNTFPAGLLALNQSESLAMKMLLDRPRMRWSVHPEGMGCSGGVPDEMFQLRTGDKIHWGLLAI